MRKLNKYLIGTATAALASTLLMAVPAGAVGPEAEGLLDETGLEIERRIKEDVIKMANGTTLSTTSAIDISDLIAGDLNNQSAIAKQMSDILCVLYRDCTAELYWWQDWCDTRISDGILYNNFKVAPDYRATEGDLYTLDADKVAAANASLMNADAIVEKYKDLSDEEKLRAYFDEVRALCEYDYESFNKSLEGEGSDTIGSNPWNLIYVFDGDDETKVICSGFAKAYEYLCNKSTFTGDINCFCVSGIYGEGTHMWNVVSINGKNYLLDATIGNYMLTAVEGSHDEGYTVITGKTYYYLEYNKDDENVPDEEKCGDITFKASTEASRTIENLDWSLSDGTLTISYDKDTMDFRFAKSYFADKGVKKIVFEEGLTAVNDFAFFEASGVEEIVLPEGVKTIGDYAFQNCPDLKKVTLPSTVESIGINAFNGCAKLQEISIPDKIKSIGNYSFYGCTSLETVKFPASLTTIGEYAFCDCTSLTAAAIPNSVTDIGKYAFTNCSAMTSANIPDGITTIGERTFYNCSSLKTATIPASVKTVDQFAFSGCKLLQGTVPANLDSIGTYAFNECNSLTGAVTIKAGTASIPDYAFYGCGSITEISLPASLTSIGKFAFYGCNGVKSINAPLYGTKLGCYFGAPLEEAANGSYIPTALTSVTLTSGSEIPAEYFQKCGNITSITLPSTAKTIGNNAFQECTALADISIPEGVTSIGEFAFYKCSGFTELELPSTLNTIGNYAFCDCSALSAVTVPAKVTSIGNYAFCNCSKLQTATVTGSLNELGERAFSGCASLTKVVLPDSVSDIGNYAFYNCAKLSSINMPASLTSIGEFSFYGCTGITGELDLGEKVTLIGTNAFRKCSGITSIILSDSFATLGDYAFFECTGIKSVTGPVIGPKLGCYFGSPVDNALNGSYIPTGLVSVEITGGTSIPDAYFQNCANLKSITLPATVKTIGNNSFQGCTGVTEIAIPTGVTFIGEFAFYKCGGLKTLTLPSTLKTIGSYAFCDCSALTAVTVPANVTSIGDYAFCNCTSLETAAVKGSVNSIGVRAFSGCSALTSITLPDTVTSIGDFAFYKCSKLASANIPKNLVTIGASSFQDCSALVCDIDINEGLESIGANAFQNCAGITSISLPTSITTLGDYAFFKCSGVKSVKGPVIGPKLGCYFGSPVDNALNGSYIPTGLVSVELTNGTAVPDAYFQACSTIKTIKLPETITAIGNNSFQNCTALTSVNVPAGVTSIGEFAFYGCTGISGDFVVGDKVTNIGSNAFRKCSGITSLTIPDGLTTLGSFAIYECTGLKSITGPVIGTRLGCYFGADLSSPANGSFIPASLENVTLTSGDALPDFYFQKCANIKSVVIPDSAKAVGANAFQACTSLEKVTIGSGVQSIGTYGFYQCSSLTEITIPEDVTSIGDLAFASCTGIKTVTFKGDAPTSISSNAFKGVTATVYYPAGANGWTEDVMKNYSGTLTWELSIALDTPVLTEAFNSATGVRVSWKAVEGATKYRLLRKPAAGGDWTNVGETTELSLIDTTAKSGSRYTYTVECINKNGNAVSGRNETGRTCVYIAVANISSVVPAADGLQITWQKPAGAKNFRVMRKVDGTSKWVVLGDVLGDTYTDTDVEYGVKYRYTVRAVTLAGDMYINSYNSVGWSGICYEAPVLTEAFNSAKGVRVSWKAVEGAAKYRLLRKPAAGGDWTAIGTTSELSLIDTTAASGSRYTYTVECINSSGKATSWYNETGRTCVYIAMANITTVAPTADGLTVTWAKPAGAKNFRVMRKVDGTSKWVVLDDVLGDTYTDTDVESGVKYWYTVRAITLAGDMYINSYNSVGWSGTWYEAPVLTEAFNSAKGVRVSWKAVEGATKYRLLRKPAAGGDWTAIGTTSELSLIDTSAKSGSRYTYTVECVNSSGKAISGYDETGRTCVYIAVANITSLKNTDDGISVTWQKPAGAKNFRVMRKVDGTNKWVILDDVLGDTYTDTNVESGVKYWYTVRAITLAGDMYINSYNSYGWSVTKS